MKSGAGPTFKFFDPWEYFQVSGAHCAWLVLWCLTRSLSAISKSRKLKQAERAQLDSYIDLENALERALCEVLVAGAVSEKRHPELDGLLEQADQRTRAGIAVRELLHIPDRSERGLAINLFDPWENFRLDWIHCGWVVLRMLVHSLADISQRRTLKQVERAQLDAYLALETLLADMMTGAADENALPTLSGLFKHADWCTQHSAIQPRDLLRIPHG